MLCSYACALIPCEFTFGTPKPLAFECMHSYKSVYAGETNDKDEEDRPNHLEGDREVDGNSSEVLA